MYPFKTNIKKKLSDIHTPVELYLKFRDIYPHSFLLESSDYKSKENHYSYICLNPIAHFKAFEDKSVATYPDGKIDLISNEKISVSEALQNFCSQFQIPELKTEFVTQGLFGYTNYDAVSLFHPLDLQELHSEKPLLQYHFFKYLIVFNHFNNELFLVEHLTETEESSLSELEQHLFNKTNTSFSFNPIGAESTNMSKEIFLDKIKQGIKHCYRGDVFQVVFSRKFKQSFTGDDFNVYRALRSINPSPYLFYFDYDTFRIFGSSPEAQLTIKNNEAQINPIAGTYKRTGKTEEDKQLAAKLSQDPKENAEHIMLVDLARNDLSKHSRKVSVTQFKEVELYSHVIHLVSKVKAKLDPDYNPIQVLGETYPAGTLSGAPKHRAMQIIHKNEPENRGFYGGAIGFLGLDKTINHAIFIRSFVSENNTLNYQAGCGIVSQSNPQNELQEVDNKLGALRKAISLAQKI